MTALTNIDRRFVAGETVHLQVRTASPGTKTPLDVTQCRMTSLKLDGEEILVSPTPFTHQAEGDYTMVLPTVGMDLGTYSLLITIDSGPSSVVILSDEFVLVSS